MLIATIYVFKNCVFNDGLSLFSDLNISQGSVAMPLRYGGIFKNNFIANLLMVSNKSISARILKIG